MSSFIPGKEAPTCLTTTPAPSARQTRTPASIAIATPPKAARKACIHPMSPLEQCPSHLTATEKSAETIAHCGDFLLRFEAWLSRENGIITNYTLHGKLITHLKRSDGNEPHFFYDAQRRPALVAYDNAVYAYPHNLQGDVVALLDANESKVVEYKYDAWGKQVYREGTLKTTLGYLNPFRYRGYVYDEETKLYYPRSREPLMKEHA